MLQTYLDNLPRHRALDGCLMFPSDWVEFGWGIDPAAPWRGRYETKEEMDALIEREGGYLNLVQCGLLAVGWRGTDRPEDGDIGVIEGVLAITKDKPIVGRIAAIHQAGRWLVRCRHGIRGIEMPALAAWSGSCVTV